MNHTPYGYEIVHGKAVINQIEAEKLRILYSEYLSGASFQTSAKTAGIKKTHSAISRLLECTHYVGDDFYPAIVTVEQFKSVAKERERRMIKFGRKNLTKPIPSLKPIKYTLDSSQEADNIAQKVAITTNKDDLQVLLLKRAEAIYSAIIGEEMSVDGK
ncbi:MAG: integrase [Clostridiales bacterium]|nr:integrase [Clostridiales bacterium]